MILYTALPYLMQEFLPAHGRPIGAFAFGGGAPASAELRRAAAKDRLWTDHGRWLPGGSEPATDRIPVIYMRIRCPIRTGVNEINGLVRTVDQEVGGSSPPSCTKAQAPDHAVVLVPTMNASADRYVMTAR